MGEATGRSALSDISAPPYTVGSGNTDEWIATDMTVTPPE